MFNENGNFIVTNQNGDPIGEECSTPSEELHSNIDVFEEEVHYFDEQTQRPFRKVQFMDEHNHFINDSLHLIQ